MALRNCFKEVGGEVSITGFFVKGGYTESSKHFDSGLLLVRRKLLLVTRKRFPC